MKPAAVLLLIAAALIPFGSIPLDAAAQTPLIQASFYPYYEFTKNVAGSAAEVRQFLPPGVEAHDWEPSISRIQSLVETDIFVYNGLGVEVYVDRLVDSPDLANVTFVKATEGLEPISTVSINDMILEILEEHEHGHYTDEGAVAAIKALLDKEDMRLVLEMYRDGELTTVEALHSVLDLLGIGDRLKHDDHGHDDHDAMEESGHDDHGHDDHDAMEESGHDDHGHDDHDAMEESGHDDHGHDDHDAMEESGHDDHGHDDHDAMEESGHDDHGHDDQHDDDHTTEIRDILGDIQNGGTGYGEGLDAIRDLMEAEEGHDHDHDHGAFDPHVWLDPVLAKQQVLNIRDALAQADPDNAETYQDNAAAYAAQLDELHSEYAAALDNCQRDTIVTFHVAFAYLVERYDFTSVSLTGISAEGDVSTADIIELVEYVKDNDVTHILAEEIRDKRNIEVIAEATGTEVLVLSPIEGISTDEFESGVTYLEKMRTNLAVLETALGCS